MYNVYCLVIRRGQGTIVKYVVNKYLVSEFYIQLRELAIKIFVSCTLTHHNIEDLSNNVL